MRKIFKKELFIFIFIPLLGGYVGYLLGGNMSLFNTINKPSFAPPKILFPIVWTILYILMGISSYIISQKKNNNEALKIYFFQLLINVFWTFFFFRLEWFLFSFIYLIFLDILVIIMMIKFSKINKKACYLQIPYLIWLIFASVLNLAIYLLN